MLVHAFKIHNADIPAAQYFKLLQLSS